MASYDRSAQKQEKKGKKGKKGGGQQPARKRKHYSDMIPYRKLANMLQSSGSKFVGDQANSLKHDKLKGDNGAMTDCLMAMAVDGVGGAYGDTTKELARKALEFVK